MMKDDNVILIHYAYMAMYATWAYTNQYLKKARLEKIVINAVLYRQSQWSPKLEAFFILHTIKIYI
jgi:hypothetical protein